jgi:hypothetical protein
VITRYSRLAAIILATGISTSARADSKATAPEQEHLLWYRKPASQWASEALPIGKSRTGESREARIDNRQLNR